MTTSGKPRPGASDSDRGSDETLLSKLETAEHNGELFRVLIVMASVFVAAAVFTFASIEKTVPPILQYDQAASPFGYTRSLALVYLPIFVLLWWFKKHPQHIRADWIGLKHTLYFLVPLWSLVDVFAAPTFFRFPNCKATLEWYVPGWIPGEGFIGRVPIEEFFFYLGASLLFLLLYVWGKAVWFVHPPSDQPLRSRARQAVPVVSFRFTGALLIGAVVVVATLFKRLAGDVSSVSLTDSVCPIPEATHSGVGYPLYLALLLIVAVGPIALLWRKMIPLINLQAMLFASLTGLLVSLMWEVTLALPYGWWDYNDYWMTGLFIRPWFGLPVEAALLWLCAGVGSVVLFELFRSQSAADVGFYRYLFGPSVGEDQ